MLNYNAELEHVNIRPTVVKLHKIFVYVFIVVSVPLTNSFCFLFFVFPSSFIYRLIKFALMMWVILNVAVSITSYSLFKY